MTAVAETPPRSLVQRMEALQRANAIRTKRANLKRDLKAGRVSIRDLVIEPPDYAHTASVLDLLLAAPKYGRVKANEALRACRISPSKTLGGLTPRQRVELASRLQVRASYAMTHQRSGTAPGAQHMIAIQLAERTRLARSVLKHQIADGEKTVTEVVLAPPWEAETMAIADLITAQHRWGRTRMRRLLASIQVPETKTLGAMTERQRFALVERLSGWATP